MPQKKQKKHGKGRRDKFYFLAKEQGYRSRAAFKLIQLNKQFEFFESARVCIDLCAAPGGWLQVATRYMPMSSLVMGIDLDPIHPIKGVTTLVGDITTPRVRKEISNFLKTWKADIFLHDGAPNMGQDWAHDAYSQALLVLESCKLACEFLTRGGTFVTKVFRSKDYNALMWVFKQLFNRVEATKPEASRGVSAEIFVVCLDYKAPDSIDPAMFEAGSVFADVEGDAKLPDIFKSTQKRNRTGYADNVGALLYKEAPLASLVDSDEPHILLADVNKFTSDDPESRVYTSHPETSPEILECLADIRVLAKSDLRKLLKWRRKMRKFAGMEDDWKKKPGAPNTKGEGDDDGGEGPSDEVTRVTKLDLKNPDEDLLAAEIAHFKERMKAIEKRKKRKARAQLVKYQQQLTLSMPTGDILQDTNEQRDLFGINSMATGTELNAIIEDGSVPLSTLDEEEVAGIFIPKREKGKGELKREEEAAAARELFGEDAGKFIDDTGRYEETLDHQLERAYIAKREARASSNVRATVGKKIKRVRRLGLSTELYMNLKAEEMGISNDRAAMAKIRPRVDGDIFAEEHAAAAAAGRGDDSSDDDADSSDEDPHSGSESESSDAKFFRQLEARRKERKAQVKDANPLLFDRNSGAASSSAALVFENDIFKGLEVEGDVDAALKAHGVNVVGKKRKRGRGLEDEGGVEEEDGEGGEGGEGGEVEVGGFDEEEYESSTDTGSLELDDSSEGSFDVVKMDPMSFSDSDDKAEYLAMAREMASRKRRESLIDKSYNRRAHNEDNLPAWYEDYLAENDKPNMPVTKEMVAELKALHKAVNARPLKRVAEAKARKKMRVVRKLDKMKRQVAQIMNDTDISESSRAKMIERLYRGGNKAMDKPKRRLIIGKRSTARAGKSMTRSYKMVDRRLRADLRGRGAPETGGARKRKKVLSRAAKRSQKSKSRQRKRR